MLEEIAANDRGEDTAKNLAGIQAQLSPRPPLGLLPWWPREVLELERWSEPDRRHDGQPPSGERGHLKRLLACTVLLRNAAYVTSRPDPFDFDEEFFLETSAASVVRLTGRALALRIPGGALGFLLWLFESQPYPGFQPFVAFCIVALAAAMDFGKASGARDYSAIRLGRRRGSAMPRRSRKRSRHGAMAYRPKYARAGA